MSRGRPAQHGRKEEILGAALRVIARAGIAGASIRNIAQESRIPSGSLNFYFASRDELLYQAFASYMDTALTEQTRHFLDEGKPILDRLVSAAMEMSEVPDSRILLAELYLLSYRDERYAALTKQWMTDVAEVLATVVPQDKVRLVDAFIEGIVVQRFFAPEQFSQAELRIAFEAMLTN